LLIINKIFNKKVPIPYMELTFYKKVFYSHSH
jgi:hypothetical protein